MYEVAARALKGAQRLRYARTAAKKRARQVSSPHPRRIRSDHCCANSDSSHTRAACMCDACAPRTPSYETISSSSDVYPQRSGTDRHRFHPTPILFCSSLRIHAKLARAELPLLSSGLFGRTGATCLTAAYAPSLFTRPVFFAACASSQPR